MHYADGPEMEVSTMLRAPVAAVWALVTDINLPSRFSDEFRGAEWIDTGGPAAVGARFRGHNENPRHGFTWDVTCTVTESTPNVAFAWVVEDPERPAASWRFSLVERTAGTELRQWARMGPGASGVTMAIDRDPENEERIVANRLASWKANMEATVAGIKALAEKASGIQV